MKKIHLLCYYPGVNYSLPAKSKADAAVAPSPTPDYPYTIKHPDYWSMDAVMLIQW